MIAKLLTELLRIYNFFFFFLLRIYKLSPENIQLCSVVFGSGSQTRGNPDDETLDSRSRVKVSPELVQYIDKNQRYKSKNIFLVIILSLHTTNLGYYKPSILEGLSSSCMYYLPLSR